MLNWATSRDSNEARDLKSLAKRLLAEIAEAIEAGNWELPPASVEATYRGNMLTWWRDAETGPPCRACSVEQVAFVPTGEGFPLRFCPACWSLNGDDRARGVSVNVGMWVEKSSRDLPPGMTMKLRLAGETFPPLLKPPATDAELAAALEAYAASAMRRLEIGRQVWMGRMTFEGMNGVRQDYAESRRWFERAATWKSGEALTTLGLMALHGLGEPVNRPKSVALCRQAAERGFPEAQTGMGRLCWDGVAVPKDEAAAVAWFRLAAERKDREAQLWLASALILGEAPA